MAFLDRFKKQTPLPIVPIKEHKENKDFTSIIGLSAAKPPVIIENKRTDYVFLSENHYYPEFLNSLIYKSSTHNSCITGKAQMTSGKSFLINGTKTADESKLAYDALPFDVKVSYDAFMTNAYGRLTIYEINKKINLDYQIHGNFALEITWSLDKTKIAAIKYVDVSRIVPEKMCEDEVENYYYCKDWSNYKRNTVIKIQSFNAKITDSNPKQYSQLLFVKNGKLDYFGTPAYIGAINWINIDHQMSVFHNNNIANAFSPSLVMKYYGNLTPEQQRYEAENFKRQYKGAENAGKALLFFARDKDSAPDVNPLEMANLDKQYIVLSEQATQQILTGHKITNTELFGVATPGRLGNSSIQDSYAIFYNTVIKPDTIVFEDLWNKLLTVNKIPVVITIEEFRPF